MADIQTLLTYLTLISVPVGVFYHIMILNNTRKNQQLQLETRQAQLFIEMTKETSGDEFRAAYQEILEQWSWTDFDDFMRKYGPDGNPEAYKKLMRITSYYERLGMLVRDGLISPQLVYHWMGSTPVNFWEKIEPYMDGYRENIEPGLKGQWGEWFEDLTYALREESEKDRIDLAERLARKKKLREALGRKTPSYLNSPTLTRPRGAPSP